MHSAASEWHFLRDLRVGTGRQNGGAQRLDAFALNTLPHMAMKRVCYEVKNVARRFSLGAEAPAKAQDRDALLERVLFRHSSRVGRRCRDSTRVRPRCHSDYKLAANG